MKNNPEWEKMLQHLNSSKSNFGAESTRLVALKKSPEDMTSDELIAIGYSPAMIESLRKRKLQEKLTLGALLASGAIAGGYLYGGLGALAGSAVGFGLNSLKNALLK